MARENFLPSLAFTLQYEGGWSDHPKDPGGATMKGVTLATFRRWVPNATKAQLKAITDEQLQRIYREDYWTPSKCDTLAGGVDLAVFDYAVNSGPAAARKSLLKAIGGNAVQTIQKLCARRLSIYQGLRTWKTFGKGWARRIAACEARAVALALAGVSKATRQQTLHEEAEKAAKTQDADIGKAAGSGAGAGATTIGMTEVPADTTAGLILLAVFLAFAAVIVFFAWRARANSHRNAAYLAELERAS